MALVCAVTARVMQEELSPESLLQKLSPML